MIPGKRVIFISLSLIATIAIAFVIHTKVEEKRVIEQARELPFYHEIPEFKLTDSESREFDSKQLNGKVWVVNFIFTSCPGVCPRLSSEMARLQKNFAKYKNLEFVSISVDPETDTPAKLTEYHKKYDADISNWHFLTGQKQLISTLMNDGFKLGFDNEPVFHSDRFVLIDPKKKIRGYYSYADEDQFKKLPQDLTKLLTQSSHP